MAMNNDGIFTPKNDGMPENNNGKPKMTVDQALAFERFSDHNARILIDSALSRGCGCVPYRDWFTYDRWAAQGLQVQKGQKGTMIWVAYENERSGKTRSRKTWVFCRCQVADPAALVPVISDHDPLADLAALVDQPTQTIEADPLAALGSLFEKTDPDPVPLSGLDGLSALFGD